MVRRRTERCKRDGREGREPLDAVVVRVEEEAETEEWGVKEMVVSGTEDPWWARMGAGVPSCDTCTPSYAGRGDAPSCWSSFEEIVEDPRPVMRVPRYRADDVRKLEEDGVAAAAAAPEDVCWESGAEAVMRTSALRSTPSTILEPEG
jgi:hypothetical protein